MPKSQRGPRTSRLPVIDKQGQAIGLITIFDIFRVLLEQGSDISITGRTPQAPPLV